MPRPAFVFNPEYEMNIGRHVFPTQKFRLLKEHLIENGTINGDEVETTKPPSDAELLSVLTPEYLADLRNYKHTRRTLRSELPITREIIDGCERTASGSIRCAQLAVERGAACHLGGGFHHGFSDHGEGFCYINDVAIAAAVARSSGICQRVSIVDTDVHQGNGTARIFQECPEVFTFSIHQERLYPVKETGDLDIGLDATPGDDFYIERLNEGLEKALDEHRPELLIYVAGADPFEADQLGNLGLTWEGMRRRDEAVLQRATKLGIPFMTVVAGGYSRDVMDVVRLHALTVEVAIAAAEQLNVAARD